MEVFSEKLQEFDKMKMVNNCRMNSAYDKYVHGEYLAYKLYNHISPYSFRVKFVEITYIDTGRKNKATFSFAFIIESEEQLAHRLNCFVIDKKKDEP